jgi:hypothetical protein
MLSDMKLRAPKLQPSDDRKTLASSVSEDAPQLKI